VVVRERGDGRSGPAEGSLEVQIAGGVVDATVVDGVEDRDPMTVRPGLPVRALVDRVRADDAPAWVLVTTPDGRLVGAVRRRHLLDLAAADELP
jgi:hypothetical protein